MLPQPVPPCKPPPWHRAAFFCRISPDAIRAWNAGLPMPRITLFFGRRRSGLESLPRDRVSPAISSQQLPAGEEGQ